MKKNLFILCVILSLISCEDSETPQPLTSTVKFNLGKSLSSDGGRSKDSLNPSSILLSIEDEDGNVIFDRHSVNLIAFGDAWITEELQLGLGDYQLTEFFVLDETENIIAAAPTEDSEYALLVNAPLPIEFTIVEGNNQLDIEVVEVEPTDTPELFGYGSFTFAWVTPKRIGIEASIASTTFDATSAIDYSLVVTLKNANGVEVWNHTWNELANTAEIVIPGGHYQYNFVLSKEGHIQHAQYYLGTQMSTISDLRFELIPEDTDEILIFNNLDGLGINYYLAADPCLYYARVDFPESLLGEISVSGYISNDRSALDPAGVPLAASPFVEVDTENNGLVSVAANLWPAYTTFAALSSSDTYCSTIPAEEEDVEYASSLLISTTNHMVLKYHAW